MKSPTLTVSGFRGIFGTELTKEVVQSFGHAFSLFLKKRNGTTVLLGRDGRQSGLEIMPWLSESLSKHGINVVDGGLLPTPSVLLLVREGDYDGAIIVTASHNPTEYNGLKFVNSEGLFLTQSEIEELEEAKNSGSLHGHPARGTVTVEENLGRKHIDKILKNVNVALIRERRFKVLIDSINGAGSFITQELLKELGVEVISINGAGDGNFTHNPEPRPEHLEETGAHARAHNVDIGFVQDPDADRLVVVSPTGQIFSEELTISLATYHVLRKERGTVVVNMSTTRRINDICAAHGVELHRTKVGEANVVAGIEAYNAVIGGEGSGGIIYPKINMARDSLTGIALILELLAESGQGIRELVREIPKYEMVKEKINFVGDIFELYEKLRREWPEAVVNNLDGLRLDWPEEKLWIHVRPSNTEPVVRIIGEGEEIDAIQTRVNTALALCA
jgi:phosphomannomutase